MNYRRLHIWHDVGNRDVQLTVTPDADPERGPENLLSESRSDVLRILATRATITGVMPSPRVASGAAMVRSNLSNRARGRLRLYSDFERQVCVYDSGEQPVYTMWGWGRFRWGIDPIGAGPVSNRHVRYTTWVMPQPVAYRAWTLDLDDPNHPAGFLQIGRFIMGMAFSPEHNFSWGAEIDWCDDGRQTRAAGGGLWTDSSTEPYRKLSIRLDNLTDADRGRLMELKRQVGTREDVFVSLYPDWPDASLVQDGALHAKFTAPRGVAQSSYNLYTNTMTLEEI